MAAIGAEQASLSLEVELKGGGTLHIDMLPDATVGDLKDRLSESTLIMPKLQRLFHEGVQIEDDNCRLDIIGGKQIGNVFMRLKLEETDSDIPKNFFPDAAKIIDERWTTSFLNYKFSKWLFRGGNEYNPPVGCVRYGIKVLDKFPKGNGWLGLKGIANDDEWPVAYHGTQNRNVMDLLNKGFDTNREVYCSLDPQQALRYSNEYRYTAPDGSVEVYQLILQCRVDITKRLLVIDKPHSRYWIMSDGSAIRPYGICAYKNSQSHHFFPVTTGLNRTNVDFWKCFISPGTYRIRSGSNYLNVNTLLFEPLQSPSSTQWNIEMNYNEGTGETLSFYSPYNGKYLDSSTFQFDGSSEEVSKLEFCWIQQDKGVLVRSTSNGKLLHKETVYMEAPPENVMEQWKQILPSGSYRVRKADGSYLHEWRLLLAYSNKNGCVNLYSPHCGHYLNSNTLAFDTISAEESKFEFYDIKQGENEGSARLRSMTNNKFVDEDGPLFFEK